MNMRDPVELKRECEVTVIPSGEKIKLAQGTWIRVTQSLGENFTLMTDEGYLVQLAGQDADAIAEKVPAVGAGLKPASTPEDVPLEKLVWDQLRTCYDPEIPVNIADLGLIYLCRITPHPEGGNQVEIKMTLTAPGCGMSEVLRTEVARKIGALPGVKDVKVDLVWDPPWNSSMLSEAAKLQLGMM